MKILGYEFKRVKNMAVPPKEVKAGSFTISKTPTRITSVDVGDFKKAVESARNGSLQNRSTLYDNYQTALDFDPILKALIDYRILATVGRKLEYHINGEPDARTQELIDAPVFERLMRDLMMARFWGMGLFEFWADTLAGRKWLNYQTIPIKHLDPYRKVVVKDQNGTDGVEWETVKGCKFVGSADDLGMMLQATMVAIYKRAAFGDWADYSELAGTNFTIVNVRGADPRTLNDITQKVNNRGAGGVMGLNQENPVDIETTNQASSQQNQLFENYSAYLNELHTRIVLGQSMTTEDGSSYAQAEVHERTQDTIFDADAKAMLDWLNYEFYDLLPMFDIPLGGRWVYAENSSSKAMQDLERDMKLKELGYTFTAEQIAQKYGLDTPASVEPIRTSI